MRRLRREKCFVPHRNARLPTARRLITMRSDGSSRPARVSGQNLRSGWSVLEPNMPRKIDWYYHRKG